MITCIFAPLILSACESLPEPIPTNMPTSAPTRTNTATAPPISTLRLTPIRTPPTVIRLSPSPTIVDLLPPFLGEVRPSPDSVLSQAQFTEFITTNIIFEGPPPPSVDYTGYRSSICAYVDVETLAEPGDLFNLYEEVFDHVDIEVNGNFLAERNNTDYIVHNEVDLECRCYFNCNEWEYPDWYNEPMPENTGCWYGMGFWGCYPVQLEPGIQNATFKFTQTSGIIHEFDWFFEITE